MAAAPRFDPALYQRQPGMVLGFHGCDETVGKRVLRRQDKHLLPRNNLYDWLGPGIYFWENDPLRAWEFARDAMTHRHLTRGKIRRPFVIGAVIELGLCLNLLERLAQNEVRTAHQTLKQMYSVSGKPMPTNMGHEFGARFLDQAVISVVHEARQELNAILPGIAPPYDTVRSTFGEGASLYAGAQLRDRNHVQIAVLQVRCIKGYFEPL